MALSRNTDSPTTATPDASSHESLGELFSRLAGETSTLVRQEVALARAELTQKAKSAAKSAVMLAVAGVFALFGGLTLLACLVISIGNAIGSYSLSALLVGGALMILAGIFAFVGLKALRKSGLAPTQTIETLREDAAWLKEQVKN